MAKTDSSPIFPPQKLPKSKKTLDWKENCVDGIIAREGSSSFIKGRSRKDRMLINYELYNGNFNEEDLKHVTNPFKVDDGFPATPQDMNVIRPKIDLLLGEESKRPFNIIVIQTNEDVVSDIMNKKGKLLKEYVMNQLNSQLTGQPNSEEEQLNPEQIDKYFRQDFKTIGERSAVDILKYYKEKLNLPNEFLKGFKDGLCAGEELYYNGIINGEPILERMNPKNCDYDNNVDIEFIEDGDWFLYSTKMTPATIYDRFYDIMTEKQLDDVLALIENSVSSRTNMGSKVNTKSIMYKDKVSDRFLSGDDGGLNAVNVWHAVWRSFKKVGFVTFYDQESGEETVTMVEEGYRKGPDEELEWDWIVEIWEGYRIGDDIYVGMQPVEYQYASIDNPNAKKLPYSGVTYSDTNSRGKSLVGVMKPLQYMYIIIWYRLELALARDKGKVINMDITQIPKSMGIDVDRWMHMLSSIGVNFINPYEEGWDIPGREGGKPAAMNQMGAIDLSMSNTIAGYIELMAKIEDMIGEISGVSKQRQGSIEQRELVGNVQRSVVQSSHITEPLFWNHGLAKKNAITIFLNTAKYAIETYDKQYIHYFNEDLSRNFFEINDEFLFSDFDVFVTDSSKEHRNLEELRSLIQPAMQNGASLLDAAQLLTTDSISDIKVKLEEIETNRLQREEEMARIQQETAQQQMQMQTQIEQEKLRIEEEDSIRDSQTAIEVALIGAESKQSDEYLNDEDIAKLELEREKLNTTKRKQTDDTDIKKRQLQESIRSNKVNEEIKRKAANKKPATNK